MQFSNETQTLFTTNSDHNIKNYLNQQQHNLDRTKEISMSTEIWTMLEAEVLCLEDLPNELWLNLLNYIPYSDKLQLRLVCKRWYDLVTLPEFVSRTIISIDRCHLNSICTYAKCMKEGLRFENIELRNLRQCQNLENLLTQIGPQVRLLKIKHSPVFNNMDGRLPNLRLLAINTTSAMDTNDHKKPIDAFDLGQFQHLTGFECDGVSLDSSVKLNFLQQLTRSQSPHIRLEHLKFEHRRDNELILLEVLGDHAATLKYLDVFLSSAPKLPVNKWAEVFIQMSKLSTLKLSGNCPVDMLNAILGSVPASAPMKHIDLTGMLSLSCEMLQNIAIKWGKTLESLELMFCVQLDDSCVTALKCLKPRLKVLSVAYCRELSSSSLVMGLAFELNNTLRELHLEEIFNLDEDAVCVLAQRLPNLRKLSMDNCRNAVSNVALARIFEHQTKLQELYIDYCIRVTDEGLLGFGEKPFPICRLRGLRVLSMRGCRHLSDRALVIGLRLPELRQLMLGYCHKFSASGFAELVLNCPALEDLCLSSCFMVEDEAVSCIAKQLKRLKKLNLSNCVNITERSVDVIATHCKELEELVVCGIDALRMNEVQLLNISPRLKDVVI